MIAKIGLLIRRNIPLSLTIAVLAVVGAAYGVQTFDNLTLNGSKAGATCLTTKQIVHLDKTGAAALTISGNILGGPTSGSSPAWTIDTRAAATGLTTPTLAIAGTNSESLALGRSTKNTAILGTESVAGLSTLTGGLTTPADVTITSTGRINQSGNGANALGGALTVGGAFVASSTANFADNVRAQKLESQVSSGTIVCNTGNFWGKTIFCGATSDFRLPAPSIAWKNYNFRILITAASFNCVITTYQTDGSTGTAQADLIITNATTATVTANDVTLTAIGTTAFVICDGTKWIIIITGSATCTA